MRSKTETTLTPRQRLNRGLTYTAAGPVDITRGVVGLGVHSARTGAAQLRQQYRGSRLAQEVAAFPEIVAGELAAAREAVIELPSALQRTRLPRRGNRRTWVLAGAAVVLVAGGGAAFVMIRRSSRPEEPSLRPPSVDVASKP